MLNQSRQSDRAHSARYENPRLDLGDFSSTFQRQNHPCHLFGNSVRGNNVRDNRAFRYLAVFVQCARVLDADLMTSLSVSVFSLA